MARRRLDDRAVLAAILYVLQTGCSWTALPASLEWITRFRRLARRYECIAIHFDAFIRLACAVICYRRCTRTGVLLTSLK